MEQIKLRPKRIFSNESDFGTTIASYIWSKVINNQNFVEQSFPIGYVLYFFASQTDANNIKIAKPNPNIWKELNGQIINDPDSPLNGITLPDLRNKFIKGTKSFGETGGQETINLSHNHGGLTNYFDDKTGGSDRGNDHTGGSYHAHPIYPALSSAENILPPFIKLSAYMRYK